MALPPVHRVDHPPILIASVDLAWDNDKIDADHKAIQAGTAEWPTLADHPVARYATGVSRYDAATIKPWLRPGEEPARFALRRLNMAEHNEVQRLLSTDQWPRARSYALKHGLADITGVPGLEGMSHPLTEAQIEKMRGTVGDAVMLEVSQAIILVSRVELDDAEKKR
jgi:hypothetical protein